MSNDKSNSTTAYDAWLEFLRSQDVVVEIQEPDDGPDNKPRCGNNIAFYLRDSEVRVAVGFDTDGNLDYLASYP